MPEFFASPSSVLTALAIAVAVVALVVWHRSKDTSVISLGWFFAIIGLPVLGPVAFLVVSRLAPAQAD